MTTRMTFDQRSDARMNARIKAEEKAVDKLDRQMNAAEPLIGELCREGKQVFYVWPQGGKYREGTRLDLIGFLIRNQYV